MVSRGKLFVWLIVGLTCFVLIPNFSVLANEDEIEDLTVDASTTDTLKETDDQVVEKEEDGIKLEGLSVSEIKKLRESAERHEFDADVSKVMKLIINSIYRNKEIFLRELISNAADALNKIRFISLTEPDALSANEDLSVYIKADKDDHVLHIIDTGIGMTKQDLLANLGTIARSGTSEFLKMVETSNEKQQDLIGQFGVGFYSSFLVADRVVVTTKHNDDEQHIWESNSSEFSVVPDPRGNTLKRGTQISLYLKEEAYEFLEPDTLKKLIEKYSQFINFEINFWQSKTETVEEPIEEETEKDKSSEDGTVEEEKEDKPKTKTSTKTVWDWERVNVIKPIWTRKEKEISKQEYIDFYKSISKDNEEPLAHVHFTAEGEVNFKAILYVPKTLSHDAFQNYGKTRENVKLFVRRVFITDNFQDMLPKHLSFIRGIVDSDDLPLSVSREDLQQSKFLKVIKKKLVRKVLDMLKKMNPETYEKFWKEYSTNMKLGVMEDPSNRNRLTKLLRFHNSHAENQTTLTDYVERMKKNQKAIYYIAGSSLDEVQTSIFIERLLKKGYEILYLTEPVDEYCIQSIPEFEGKQFQNIAKEGLNIDEDETSKSAFEALQKTFEPLVNWLKDTALVDLIDKAVVSQRLTTSPSALVASSYGWSGNMERIMTSQAYAKANDPTQTYYANQKKTFEINARHPIIKELLKLITEDSADINALSTAQLLYETATLRSGYALKNLPAFAERIEGILRKSLNLSEDEQVEEEPEAVEEPEKESDENVEEQEEEKIEVEENEHEEL